MPGIEKLSFAGGLDPKDTAFLKSVREKTWRRQRSPPKMKRPTFNPKFLKTPPGIRSPLKGRSPASSPKGIRIPTPPATPTATPTATPDQLATFSFQTPVRPRPARDDEKMDREIPLVPRIYPARSYRPVVHDFDGVEKFTRTPDLFRDLKTERWHLDRAIRFGLVGGHIDMSWRGRRRKRSSESELRNRRI